MSSGEIDDYIARFGDPTRSALERLRRMIEAVIPEAEQGISYGAPCFRIAGTPVAGFSAAKHHISYLPHSGGVLGNVDPDELGGFSASKGAVKLPIGGDVPERLVRTLIAARRSEAGV